MSQTVPEIKEDLSGGQLNLMQVSMLAQSVRQKQRENPDVTVSWPEDQRKILDELEK